MTHNIDLFHATAALRAFVNRKALEDLFGARGSGKVAQIEWDNERARGASRFRRPVDLRVPAPRTERPQNSGGWSTTHVSIEVVRKVAAPSVGSGKKAAGNGASAYSNYITGFAKGGDVAYLTQPKTEAEPGSGEHRVAAFVSNISSDFAELEAYWNERYDAGRNTGEHRLELYPDRGRADDWQALADADDTPLRIARTAARMALLLRAGRSPRRRVIRGLDKDVLLWSGGLRKRFGKEKDERILHFARPRCARIQMKIVFEFDERLTAAERLRVLSDLRDRLDASGVRMLAVAHDPDANNDPRNFHPHVLIDPTIYPVEDGRTVHGWGKKMRPGELAGILAYLPLKPPTPYRKLGKLDHQAVRQFVVRLGNDQLAKRGLQARFHAGSFAALGIEKQPNQHLGSRAAAQVAVGALVEFDYLNALNDWRYAIAEREADLAQQERMLSRFAEAAREDLGCLAGDDAKALEARLARHAALAATVAEQARALAHFDLLGELARSAAERLKSKTGRIVTALDQGGKVTAADRKNQAHLRARHALATMHLNEIEEALAPYVPAIAAERMALAAGVRELAELEQSVRHQVEAAKALAAQQAWSKASVIAGPHFPDPPEAEAHFHALKDHVLGQFSATSAVPGNAVVHVFEDAGTGKLTAIGLRSADTALVSDGRFVKRWAGVLSQAEWRQRQAISRLSKFVEVNGRDRLVLGRSWNGTGLPSTLQRQRDGLAGHPTLASELDRAESMYQQTGNNDHYLHLRGPSAASESGTSPARGETAAPVRNPDTQPSRPAKSKEQPAIEPAPAPAQTKPLAQPSRPAAPVSGPATPSVHAPDIANPTAIPPPIAQPSIGPETQINSESWQALPSHDVQPAPGSSSVAKRADTHPEKQVRASATRSPDDDSRQSPPAPSAMSADEYKEERLTPAHVRAAEPAQIASPVPIGKRGQNGGLGQTDMSGPTASADAATKPSDRVVVRVGSGVAPPARSRVVRPQAPDEERSTSAASQSTDPARDPATLSTLADVYDRKQRAARKDSAAEILRAELAGHPPTSLVRPATKEASAPPRPIVGAKQASQDREPSTSAAPHSTDLGREAMSSILADVYDRKRRAARKDPAAETLRAELAGQSPTSLERSATKQPPAPPRPIVSTGQASPPRSPKISQPPKPDRAATVARVLAFHKDHWSKVVTGMPYSELEQRAAMFVVPIRRGDLSITIEAGEVRIGGTLSDTYTADLHTFAQHPAGWILLAQLATSLSDETLPPGGTNWTSVPAPSVTPDDWERKVQAQLHDVGCHR